MQLFIALPSLLFLDLHGSQHGCGLLPLHHAKAWGINPLPPFFKIPHPPTLPANWSSQVFLINRNATVKLSSINTIHVKQQHNVGFFIFRFTLKYILGIIKYMLGNVYNTFILQGKFCILCCIQRNPSHIITKQFLRKDFSLEQLKIDTYWLLCKQKNSISINQ